MGGVPHAQGVKAYGFSTRKLCFQWPAVTKVGSIPDALVSCTTRCAATACQIALVANQLSGTLPHAYSYLLHGPSEIALGQNQLSGTIPSAMASLSVWYLRLDKNVLSGAVPDLLLGGVVLLNGNKLTGALPSLHDTLYPTLSFRGCLIRAH